MKGIFIIAIIGLLIGCAGAKIKREKPAEVIYKEAMSFFERKNYEDAIAAFQEMTAKYPLSTYAVQAKLKIADAHFMGGNYPEAISAYRDFEKLHPTNENIPYAIFQIGMSYFNQVLTIDRDQTSTRNAAIEFERLLSRFPDSRYSEDARKNLQVCRNNLAENEFYIGNFYYRKGNYKPAIERFSSVMDKYPEFSAMDKVLFYAGKAYLEIKEEERGRDLLKRLLERFPGSEFAKDARDIVGVE
jgi:outer membrane protein assembly factor BamD